MSTAAVLALAMAIDAALGEPRWLFFVRPAAIQTWQGVDWAKKYKHSDWGAS